MTSDCTRGPVAFLCDFGSVLRQPLDTCLWALTILGSRLLARVCVDVPSSATYLNWSLIFEWYMNKYGSKNI